MLEVIDEEGIQQTEDKRSIQTDTWLPETLRIKQGAYFVYGSNLERPGISYCFEDVVNDS